jgi:hypothetical protein
VSNAHEAFGQYVQQQATEKLDRGQRGLAPVARAKAHGASIHVQQAGIADADAVSVPAEIGKDGRGTAERRLAVDQPTFAMKLIQKALEGERVARLAEPVELEGASLVQGSKAVKKFSAKQCAQNADRKQVARAGRNPATAIGTEAAASHDAVQMRMKAQIARPGVKDRGDTQQPTQAFSICAELEEGLRSRLEQQGIQEASISEHQRTQLGRQREHHVKVMHGQDALLAGIEPAVLRQCLALWTVPVAARVVLWLPMAAAGAQLDVSAESSGATSGDRR